MQTKSPRQRARHCRHRQPHPAPSPFPCHPAPGPPSPRPPRPARPEGTPAPSSPLVMVEGQPSAHRAAFWELKSPQRRRARGPGLASRRAPAARAPCRPCCASGAPRYPSPVPAAPWSPRGRRRHVRPLPQLGGRRAREGRPQHPLLGPPQVRAGGREGRGCPPVVGGGGGPGCFPQELAAALSVFAPSSPGAGAVPSWEVGIAAATCVASVLTSPRPSAE